MRSVLEILSASDYVSGESIGAELGISRAAVWKKISALRSDGWEIASAGKRGYRLLAGDRLEPELWTHSLNTNSLGRGENRYLFTTDSTNAEAKRMAAAGAPHGSLCLCETQTHGRGRRGRSWHSPEGRGLWLTLLLRPELAPQDAPLLTFCSALAMRRAVLSTTGLAAAVKWPNDLILNQKKICGILLELAADPDKIEYVVIGTGLNVRRGAYPPELSSSAASLEVFLYNNSLPLRRDILCAYLTHMEELIGAVSARGLAAIREEYVRASCTLGREVLVSGAVQITGTAEDIDGSGALLVRDADGRIHRLLAGDVSVRGVMGCE